VDSRNDEPLEERIEVISRWNHWMEKEYTALFAALIGK